MLNAKIAQRKPWKINSNSENGATKNLLNTEKLRRNVVDTARLKLKSITEKTLTLRANSPFYHRT